MRTYRIRQWVKSGFVLAPALFTLHFLDPKDWVRLFMGVSGFSLVASAGYVLNDILNRNEDRLHPVKRLRPIVTGELSLQIATLGMLAALAGGLALLWAGSSRAAVIGSAYFFTMAAYSLWLRKLLIVDLLVIATGFVLRILVGASLIREPISHWLLLCTFTIALYLGLVKRRQEIAALGDGDPATRSVLKNYPPLAIIDGWITVVTAMTLICYALYTVDPETVAKHHTDALIYTLPLALYGVFRYQKLALTGRAGEDPTELVLKDGGLKIVVLLWTILVAVILSLAQQG